MASPVTGHIPEGSRPERQALYQVHIAAPSAVGRETWERNGLLAAACAIKTVSDAVAVEDCDIQVRIDGPIATVTMWRAPQASEGAQWADLQSEIETIDGDQVV